MISTCCSQMVITFILKVLLCYCSTETLSAYTGTYTMERNTRDFRYEPVFHIIMLFFRVKFHIWNIKTDMQRVNISVTDKVQYVTHSLKNKVNWTNFIDMWVSHTFFFTWGEKKSQQHQPQIFENVWNLSVNVTAASNWRALVFRTFHGRKKGGNEGLPSFSALLWYWISADSMSSSVSWTRVTVAALRVSKHVSYMYKHLHVLKGGRYVLF